MLILTRIFSFLSSNEYLRANSKDRYILFQTYEVCTGADLACSNEILNRMGQYNKEMNAK